MDAGIPTLNGPTCPSSRIDGVKTTPLRVLLREATQDSHGRLHSHEGFARVQAATIDLPAYCDLLLRLYGFYLPFEAMAEAGSQRSRWLEEDLLALGADDRLLASAMCPNVPALDTAERRLGAHYVVEGSALGGGVLAKGLDALLGVGVAEGRRFFTGRGRGTAEAWNAYLARLTAASTEPAAQAGIVEAATETFAVFEQWLTGWKDVARG